jgi:hypothetical protein
VEAQRALAEENRLRRCDGCRGLKDPRRPAVAQRCAERDHGSLASRLFPQALELFRTCIWSGNVTQLRDVVEGGARTCTGVNIAVHDVGIVTLRQTRLISVDGAIRSNFASCRCESESSPR